MSARSYSPDVIMVRRGRPPHHYLMLPVDDQAADAIEKMPEDEVFGIRIVRNRSLPQHRMFWSILDHVAQASVFENAERLLVALKIRLGRYDLMKMPNGKVVPVPQSISFDGMSQSEFQKFFDEAIVLICTEIIPGTDPMALVGQFEPNWAGTGQGLGGAP